jgi:hypothetical protein
MLKEEEATKDTPVKTISGANPEEAIDAKVTKIAKEKQSASDDSDDTSIVCDIASNDVGEGDRVEV